MTSVDSNFNFLCGRPQGAGPPPPAPMRPPEADPLPPPCGCHKWMAPYWSTSRFMGPHLGIWISYNIYCKETNSSASGLQLRSTDKYDLLVRRMKTRIGDRAFSAAGPKCWNSLPAATRAADSIDLFKNAYSAVS